MATRASSVLGFEAPEAPVVTIAPDSLAALLTEISRNRALADHETDLLEECVLFGQLPFRWTPQLDGALMRASRANGGIARFARRHNIRPHTAYVRLYRMRRRHG